MDDYETHDDRRLLGGTGFTIEPGSVEVSEATALSSGRDASKRVAAEAEVPAIHQLSAGTPFALMKAKDSRGDDLCNARF
jgi:metal-dependent HD superfamily phosphatase/phosphodiesterase